MECGPSKIMEENHSFVRVAHTQTRLWVERKQRRGGGQDMKKELEMLLASVKLIFDPL